MKNSSLEQLKKNREDRVFNLPRQLKINLFKSTVEPILIYGLETNTQHSTSYETWWMPYKLCRVQIISWHNHATLKDIYGKITPIISHVRQWGIDFPGHIYWQWGIHFPIPQHIYCLGDWNWIAFTMVGSPA